VQALWPAMRTGCHELRFENFKENSYTVSFGVNAFVFFKFISRCLNREDSRVFVCSENQPQQEITRV
jgi:hypothetical protein